MTMSIYDYVQIRIYDYVHGRVMYRITGERREWIGMRNRWLGIARTGLGIICMMQSANH
jgi:hypothetical protein